MGERRKGKRKQRKQILSILCLMWSPLCLLLVAGHNTRKMADARHPAASEVVGKFCSTPAAVILMNKRAW